MPVLCGFPLVFALLVQLYLAATINCAIIPKLRYDEPLQQTPSAAGHKKLQLQYLIIGPKVVDPEEYRAIIDGLITPENNSEQSVVRRLMARNSGLEPEQPQFGRTRRFSFLDSDNFMYGSAGSMPTSDKRFSRIGGNIMMG